MEQFKSGFVNIVGNPNVGKSTLMNTLVGERISIITSKAQTTRHRIMGIVNGENFQIVYSDTPGVLKPNYKLQESMLKFSTGAIGDADVILYVTDVVENVEKNLEFIEKVRYSAIPTIVVINKIDLTTPENLEILVDKLKSLLPEAIIVPTSALTKFNIENLFNLILEKLPVGEPFYDKEALTDRPTRFFASEIIREKILLTYEKEIPYCVEVVVEEYKEGETLDKIRAIIYVARDSQKGIIIGHKGKKLKEIGTKARLDLEEFLQKKVFLDLYVKVSNGWRDSERALKSYGYLE
ncbi:MAG: GTPase Era [Rikenellaceae bacterium]